MVEGLGSGSGGWRWGRRAGGACFQCGDGLFQCVEFFARAQQHRALHVELFAGDQVQLAQAGLQCALEGALQFFARLAQARRHQVAEAAGEVVELIEIDHGCSPQVRRKPSAGRNTRDIGKAVGRR
ncbi:hypothetical protein XGA_0659 [Xanthomonas hortorum ATCC 19865]|nr:hypothetical protein XGA_0659 [Xanthomonas hortorum ATCC 19865]